MNFRALLLIAISALVLAITPLEAEAAEGQTGYQYDALGRLTAAQYSNDPTKTSDDYESAYTYDPAGNRTASVISGVSVVDDPDPIIDDPDPTAGNYGIEFDGSGDALLISGVTGFPTTAATIDIDFIDHGSAKYGTLFSFATATVDDEIRIGNGSNTNTRAYFHDDNEDDEVASFDGDRHRLTVTWSTPTIRYYLDGIYISTDETDETDEPIILNGNGSLMLGHKQASMGILDHSNYGFKGTIYRVRAWDTVLSASQVASGDDVAPDDLLVDFDFTEGSGTSTTDSAGNYTASFKGNPQWVDETTSDPEPDPDPDPVSTTSYKAINPTAITEGASVTLVVERTGTAIATETIQYATQDNTAKAGADYTAKSGTLSFAINDTSKSITLATTDDSVDENREYFYVKLSANSDGTIADSSGTVSIDDNDDEAPSIITLTNSRGYILSDHSAKYSSSNICGGDFVTVCTFTVRLAGSGTAVWSSKSMGGSPFPGSGSPGYSATGFVVKVTSALYGVEP